MQYIWSKISLRSTEKVNYFDFDKLETLFFCAHKNQYLTLGFLHFEEAL